VPAILMATGVVDEGGGDAASLLGFITSTWQAGGLQPPRCGLTRQREGGRETSTHHFGFLRKGVDVRGALCDNKMSKAGVLLQNV
jgi:hypothetical protein